MMITLAMNLKMMALILNHLNNVLASDLPDIAKQDFNGCRTYYRINPQHSNKYFRIRIGNSIKYLHKQTACWLPKTNKTRLSND